MTFPIMQVMKIPQQKYNIFKALEDENPKERHIEATIMTQKPQLKRGKVPPLFISLEIDNLIIHNCMDDCGATHKSMPL